MNMDAPMDALLQIQAKRRSYSAADTKKHDPQPTTRSKSAAPALMLPVVSATSETPIVPQSGPTQRKPEASLQKPSVKATQAAVDCNVVDSDSIGEASRVTSAGDCDDPKSFTRKTANTGQQSIIAGHVATKEPRTQASDRICRGDTFKTPDATTY